MSSFFAPEPLGDHHRLDGFRCGVDSLDRWLVKRARANSVTGASRVFVVCDEDGAVVAYYSLSTGSVLREELPKPVRRNAPQPVPVLLIGRFAVDASHRGEDIGRSLLQDALLRCARLSQEVGFTAVLVHPVDERADAFWQRFGFAPAPTHEPMLALPVSHLTGTRPTLGHLRAGT